MWRHPVAVFLLADRADFPSMATGTRPVAWHAAVIHLPKARANAARRRHPSPEGPGERRRVEFGEDPAEGVGAGDAVVQPKRPAEERLLAAAIFGDRLPGLGSGDDHTGGDRQDVGQAVELVLCVAAGVGQVIEDGSEEQGWHRELLRVPLRYSQKSL
jgi:hypothetical protein